MFELKKKKKTVSLRLDRILVKRKSHGKFARASGFNFMMDSVMKRIFHRLEWKYEFVTFPRRKQLCLLLFARSKCKVTKSKSFEINPRSLQGYYNSFRFASNAINISSERSNVEKNPITDRAPHYRFPPLRFNDKEHRTAPDCERI